MRRSAAFLAVLSATVLAGAGGATAQSQSPEPSVTRNLCLTLSGPLVETVEELTELIVSGVIIIDEFVEGGCDEAFPEESLAPATDEPLPVEVVDQGFTVDGGYLYYAVVLRNPNPSTWVADAMPVQVDVLGVGGDLITTDSAYITLVPGQTSAVVSQVSDAKGAKRLDVIVSNGEDDWESIDYEPGEFTFSQVKTKQDRYSATTTGRMRGNFEERQEDVTVIAVYRNKAGKVVGGWSDYVDFVPAGGSASFRIDGFTTFPPIGKTEIYYEF